MIEFDLGEEPEYADLVFVNEDGSRGTEQGAALEPLNGRVKVNGPRGFKITETRVAGDEGLRRFIEEGSDRVDYYYVRLGVDFVTHGGPRLDSAQVKLVLTAVPEMPVPFALSVRPHAKGLARKVRKEVTIGPKLTLPVVGEAEAGAFKSAWEHEETRLFVSGLGLEGSTPSWQFDRISGQRIEGSCRLEVIVQAGRGAQLSVSGTATAQTTVGNLPWHWRAQLPNPLTFGADV
jgi:hypothetical protein